MKDLRSRIDAVLASQPSASKSHIPDPKLHKYISFGKSAIRIVAGAFLVTGNIVLAGVALIVAEVLGVVEEIV